MRWAKGPVYFPAGRYLVVSDIPNNRMMRYDEMTGNWGVFRQPSNQSNGNTRDLQGRLVTCEHLTRRVTRTEHDGRITVLADNYQGKRLNSPNDIVCKKSDGSIWFSDPPFGIADNWKATRRRRNCRNQCIIYRRTDSCRRSSPISRVRTVWRFRRTNRGSM